MNYALQIINLLTMYRASLILLCTQYTNRQTFQKMLGGFIFILSTLLIIVRLSLVTDIKTTATWNELYEGQTFLINYAASIPTC
jgi:hypothetical protein